MKKLAAAAGVVAALFSQIACADSNVALGKIVDLNGVYGVAGWGGPPSAAGSTLVDGAYFPEQHQWDIGTVWWDAHQAVSANNSIDIGLGGNFSIHRLNIQADNNDKYLVQYNDHGTWRNLWTAGETWQWGVTTRDSGTFAAVTTDRLRVIGVDGDHYYSVSEVQAFGAPVPEPETYLMLLSGLAGLGLIAKRRKAKIEA